MTEHIWKSFHEQLFGFIKARVHSTETAEDILQEIFIKIHKNVKNIKNEQKIASWVYQITRNTIIDYYRKKKIDTKDYTSRIDDFFSETTEEVGSQIDFIKCL